MSKVKFFFMLSGYQLTWLMCIFGEILYKSFLPGLACGLIFLFLVFINTQNKKKLIFIVSSISVVGYLFDSILVNLKIYNFDSSLLFGWLPIWMLVLWPSFATLFDEVFVFLSKYKLIALLLSAVLGPLTYYSGSPLGIIYINQLFLFFILMTTFWTFLMLFYLYYLLKVKIN
ncbi:DUF2878 domain-containing protein [Pelagibacteraceae bacterium]|nr:DUF2878 domain-containing protein [Pelagibacteraceae bacterium]